ncbi:mechanosensitive ion channel [bacterium]|nr:mechanosensitive ion channel [bacterium]
MVVWYTGVFGLTYGQVFTAIGLFLLALLVRGIFARTIVRAISRAAAGTKTNLDDALVKSIAEPLKMVPIIVGVYVAMEVIDLGADARVAADKLLQSMVAVSIFWTLSRAVSSFSFLLGGFRETLNWLLRTLEVLFLAMGAAAVLEIWGVPILPVIGGLGVFGIAVAFGAQDLVKNLISGVFILVERRFAIGDWIKVDGVVEGVVEKMGFRSITVRQFDKAPIYVPNAVFNDNPVANFSRMSHRRIKWVVGVEYRTTVEQLRYIRDEIEAFLWVDEAFAMPPEAALMVNVDSFNDSSIDFLIYTFTRTTKWDEWLGHKERLAYKVMEIVKAAGTDFAFPSRTLYMQQTDPPEIFAPPGRSPQVEEVAKLRAARRLTQERSGETDGE